MSSIRWRWYGTESTLKKRGQVSQILIYIRWNVHRYPSKWKNIDISHSQTAIKFFFLFYMVFLQVPPTSAPLSNCSVCSLRWISAKRFFFCGTDDFIAIRPPIFSCPLFFLYVDIISDSILLYSSYSEFAPLFQPSPLSTYTDP